MAGSKYVMEVNVTGNAENKLAGIEKGVGKVAAAGNRLRDAFGRFAGNGGGGGGGKDDPLERIAGNTRISALHSLQSELDNLGSHVDAFNSKLIGASTDLVKGIVNDAAGFEDAAASMKFAFGKDWTSVMDQVKADSARLTFTFKDTVELAASLGRMNINPFGGVEASQQQFKSKTGEMIRALDILQDTADAAGKSTQDLTVSIRNALSGQWRSLQDRFDIPMNFIKEWKKEIEKAKTPQEKYNILIGKLGELYGGAGALKAQNFNKAIAQLPDMMEQLKAGIGAEGLKLITQSIITLVDALKGLIENKDAMMGLSNAFRVVARTIAFVVTTGAKLITFITEILAKAPFLPVLAVGFTVVAVAVLFATGTVLGITAAVVGLVIAIGMLEIEMLPLVALAVVLIGALGIGFAFATAAAVLFAKVALDVSNNMSGVADTFEGVKNVVTGLFELISSYNGKTASMSLSTRDALKKAGMLEFVKNAFSVFHKLNVAVTAFFSTLDDVASDIGPEMLEMFDAIKEAVSAMFDGDGTGQTLTWAEAAQKLARGLGAVVKAMAIMTTKVLQSTTLRTVLGGMVAVVINLAKAAYYALTAIDALFTKLEEGIRISKAFSKGGPAAAEREMDKIKNERADRDFQRKFREAQRAEHREKVAMENRRKEVGKTKQMNSVMPMSPEEQEYVDGKGTSLSAARAKTRGRSAAMSNYDATGQLPGETDPILKNLARPPEGAMAGGGGTAGGGGDSKAAAATQAQTSALSGLLAQVVSAIGAMHMEVSIGDDVIARAANRAGTGVAGS